MTPSELAEEWVSTIEAPQKASIPIRGASHLAFVTASDTYLTELLGRVRPLALEPRLQQATRFRAVTGNEGEILYEIKTGRTGAVPALLRVRTMPRSITRLLCLCSPWMATPNCQHRPSLLNNNWRSAAPEPEH